MRQNYYYASTLLPGYTQTFNVRWKKTLQFDESTVSVSTNDPYNATYSYKVAGKSTSGISREDDKKIKCYYEENGNNIIVDGISHEGKEGVVILYDVTGNVVAERNIDESFIADSKISIPLQELSYGIYYLQISILNQIVFSNRIVLQR